MKNWKLSVLSLTVLGLFIASCSDKEDSNTSELKIEIDGLEDLGSNAIYEGWIIVNGSPISTGTFSVDASGNLSKSAFEVLSGDLENATSFVLTIEPSPDNDPAPSDVHILAGDFSGNQSILTIEHESALGDDFTSASGQYILATPTDGNGDIDENSGVWFLDPSGPEPTLNLPTLPAGWIYEGWAVIDGIPVSTGTFSQASGNDGLDIYSGDISGPPFPGEDFLKNAPNGLTFPTDLSGAAIVISIEPVPDNSSSPFTLKPLFAEVQSNPMSHNLYALSNNINNSNINGMVVR